MRSSPRKLSNEEELYAAALRALMRRAYSVFEMRTYLERRSEDATLARHVVARIRQEKLLDDARYALEFARARAKVRRQGRYRGVGLAAFIEPTGAGAETNGPGGAPVIAVDGATVKLEPSGGIRCLTGATEQGQGTTAAIAQIVASALGVAVDDVIVVSSDTGTIPVGSGAWASRGIIGGGEAAWRAARLLPAESLRND